MGIIIGIFMILFSLGFTPIGGYWIVGLVDEYIFELPMFGNIYSGFFGMPIVSIGIGAMIFFIGISLLPVDKIPDWIIRVAYILWCVSAIVHIIGIAFMAYIYSHEPPHGGNRVNTIENTDIHF